MMHQQKPESNIFVNTITQVLREHGFSPNSKHAANLEIAHLSHARVMTERDMGYIVSQGTLTLGEITFLVPWFIVTMIREGNYGKACNDAVYAAQVIREDLHATVLRTGNVLTVFQSHQSLIY